MTRTILGEEYRKGLYRKLREEAPGRTRYVTVFALSVLRQSAQCVTWQSDNGYSSNCPDSHVVPRNTNRRVSDIVLRLSRSQPHICTCAERKLLVLQLHKIKTSITVDNNNLLGMTRCRMACGYRSFSETSVNSTELHGFMSRKAVA